MDWLAMVIVLAAAFLTSLWVSRPFNRQQTLSPKTASKNHKIEMDENLVLEAEHQRVLDAVMELDFDHDSGKVDEENYQIQRQGLLQMGAGILRKLDAKK